MNIKISKASGRCKCRGQNCPRNPKYIDVDKNRIIKDTYVAGISMRTPAGYYTSYYCYDCLQAIHTDMKLKLNPNYWNFN